jgi:hypothetical protein
MSNSQNGKGDSLRKGANLSAYWNNYDSIFRKSPIEKTITDGEQIWLLCKRPDCGLHVVRMGKVQCWCDDEDGPKYD